MSTRRIRRYLNDLQAGYEIRAQDSGQAGDVARVKSGLAGEQADSSQRLM